MEQVFKEIRKHCYIYFIFVKNCLIAQMEYRFNFFMAITIEAIYLLTKIMYIVVVYRAGTNINGLSPDAILMFVGTFTIMTAALMGLFFTNQCELPRYIQNGSLDMFITKPISLQFFVTLRYVDFGFPIPDFIAGTTMVIIGWNRLSLPFNFVNIAGFMGFVISGTIMTYALFYITPVLSFWLVKTNGIGIITWQFWDFNNMPMSIYPKLIQRVGIFVLPVFMISNFAPMFVLGKLSIVHVIWAIVGPILFLTIFRLIWNAGIKNYTSASS